MYASKNPTTIASVHSILKSNLPRFLRKLPYIIVVISLGVKILGFLERTHRFTLIGARMGYLAKKIE
jgi:hypothetical protein